MNAALAYNPEYDEVALVSIEVLDTSVSKMRGEVIERRAGDRWHAAADPRILNSLRNHPGRSGLLNDRSGASVAHRRAEVLAAELSLPLIVARANPT